MKIYAVGDIHGQLHKLRNLMDRLYMDDNYLLVFLGDYIDRGDYSFEVIEYLIGLNNKYNCIFLKGNHEEMFIDFLSGIEESLFVINGGRKTIESYKNNKYNIDKRTKYTDRRIPSTHMEFFRKLKTYYQTKDYIFVHAGLLPEDIPLEEQPEDILLWERYDFINSDFDWGKKVIFGHTPNREVLNMHNKICIDTGAYYEDGKLTCVILPEERFVQQDVTTEEASAYKQLNLLINN